MDDQLTYRSGFKDVLPTVFGYIGVGIAFGIVAKTYHLSVLMVLLMSLIVYAGSAQFIITGMLAAGSPIGAIVVSTILINARMSLMSMTVAPYFKDKSFGENIGVGSLLTDETFALSMNKLNFTDHKLNGPWLNSANIVAYLVWALATVAGSLIGGLIPNPESLGLDFAVVAMFIGLLYLQIITDRSRPLLKHLQVFLCVAILMIILMRFMAGNSAILLATILGCLFGMAVNRK
ncbi:amino acid transport protein [Agrilactobacillus composti DSM 18527 = JCM 14202]|uniref:Amino acid transport protein n=1 Tax=Agrilactobacillus composti DSM 18527 = JCM 14202 TaxID=1423734 RepID=X0PF70_9LACO|nr:AzlC family ABC transporter permease [Agrilactobacillus composti]KRM35063.1 amino acid transport protein [Agrilactobacillus composti DSM 18527 = JCM 14202]GAF40494.1 hypothetical protein JCM14202_2393 [Agrilactobacillus composti DSM 18527 = JCM 14202]